MPTQSPIPWVSCTTWSPTLGRVKTFFCLFFLMAFVLSSPNKFLPPITIKFSIDKLKPLLARFVKT